MNTLRAQRPSEPQAPGGSAPSVAPTLPLLLLETLRDMDRPTEVLEDEDLSLSMPRRLGLSDVVSVQIRRLREETRQKRPQPVAGVEDLIRLVIRRPDADEIFTEAGRRIARGSWEQRSGAMRRAVELMPRPLAALAGHRAAKRLLATLAGGADLRLTHRPTELRLDGCFTARADPGGSACALYTGVLSELLRTYTGRDYRVRHAQCEARGAESCTWIAEVAS